ncbi:something about silencing protein 10-like protein [Tanacetum coccineum]
MVIDNGGKRKRQNEQLGVEGVKMLKVRAALDKKGVYNLKAMQVVKKNNLKPINRNLESGNTFDEDSETDSECDLYQKTKLESDAKLAAKAQKYSRTAPSVLAAPETQLDDKRHISCEGEFHGSMEKNRGLTRKRNKDIKNPRKKHKHDDELAIGTI